MELTRRSCFSLALAGLVRQEERTPPSGVIANSVIPHIRSAKDAPLLVGVQSPDESEPWTDAEPPPWWKQSVPVFALWPCGLLGYAGDAFDARPTVRQRYGGVWNGLRVAPEAARALTQPLLALFLYLRARGDSQRLRWTGPEVTLTLIAPAGAVRIALSEPFLYQDAFALRGAEAIEATVVWLRTALAELVVEARTSGAEVRRYQVALTRESLARHGWSSHPGPLTSRKRAPPYRGALSSCPRLW